MARVVVRTEGGGTATFRCDKIEHNQDGTITLKGIDRQTKGEESNLSSTHHGVQRHDRIWPKAHVLKIYEE